MQPQPIPTILEQARALDKFSPRDAITLSLKHLPSVVNNGNEDEVHEALRQTERLQALIDEQDGDSTLPDPVNRYR